MRVVVRTDSSGQIGTGHIMRCLTLADRLTGQGAAVSFICRELPGNLIDFIESKAYRVYRLPDRQGGTVDSRDRSEYDRWLAVDRETDAIETGRVLADTNIVTDWLVVDHYALDAEWEQGMRPYADRIMAIDDLANRRHDCDLLLDQNFHANALDRYDNLVPDHCRMLLGPQYALLRPEFGELRDRIRQRDGKISQILIFFGGADATNETVKALLAVRSLDRPDIAVDVVVGGSNPHRTQIENVSKQVPNVRLHYQTREMAQLMAEADLAIGAGGTTTWERCCLGLPSLIIAVADNQIPIGRECGNAGVSWYLGTSIQVTRERLAKKVAEFLNKPELAREMARRSLAMVDGQGARRATVLLCKALKHGVLK